MSVSQFMSTLRQMVLEHPFVADEELVIHVDSHQFRQIGAIHTNLHGTRVVIEGKE